MLECEADNRRRDRHTGISKHGRMHRGLQRASKRERPAGTVLTATECRQVGLATSIFRLSDRCCHGSGRDELENAQIRKLSSMQRAFCILKRCSADRQVATVHTQVLEPTTLSAFTNDSVAAEDRTMSEETELQ
jgi:hypothetical protein